MDYNSWLKERYSEGRYYTKLIKYYTKNLSGQGFGYTHLNWHGGFLSAGINYFEKKHQQSLKTMINLRNDALRQIVKSIEITDSEGKAISESLAMGELYDALSESGFLQEILQSIADGVNKVVNQQLENGGKIINFEEGLQNIRQYAGMFAEKGKIDSKEIAGFVQILENMVNGVLNLGKKDKKAFHAFLQKWSNYIKTGKSNITVSRDPKNPFSGDYIKTTSRKTILALGNDDLIALNTIKRYLVNAADLYHASETRAKKKGKKGYSKETERLSKNSFNQTITNIVSSPLGEMLSADIIRQGYEQVNEDINQIIQESGKKLNAKMVQTGSGMNVKVIGDKYAQNKESKKRKRSKTDIIASNLFTFSIELNDNIYNLTLNTNTSAKWYKTIADYNRGIQSDKYPTYISIVSGTRLSSYCPVIKDGETTAYFGEPMEIFWARQMFAYQEDSVIENEYTDYLSPFFIQAWLMGSGDAYITLPDKVDTSPFLMINGRLISNYQLLSKYIEELEAGKNYLSLEFKGRNRINNEPLYDYNSLNQNAWHRSQNIVNAFNTGLTLSAKLAYKDFLENL